MLTMRSILRPDHALMGLGKLLLAFFLVGSVLLWRSPNLPKSFFYTVVREFSKSQMALKTFSWPKLESRHFIVKYRPGDEESARLVLESAEEFYRPVVDRVGFQPRGKSLLVIYPTRESLGKSFGWAADESAMGVYWAGVIRILSPKEWIFAATPEERKALFNSSGPIAHEFAHLLVDYRTGGNYTRWYTEGLALYTEYKLTGFRFQGPFNGTLYPLQEMDAGFDNLPDQNLAYRQSFSVILYLVETYGEDKLQLTLEHLSRGETIEQAFANSLGVSFKTFETDFQGWVKERGTI